MQSSRRFPRRLLLVWWGVLLVTRSSHHHGVSASLDMRRYKNWAHKLSSWVYLSEGLSGQFFPGRRAPRFCSSPRTPFRGCWRSAAAAAPNSILAEVGGERPWQVPICIDSWQWKTTRRLCVEIQFSSVQFSRSVVSDSLWPHKSQHARPPCPLPTPGVHWDSRPSS